jgi:hypothetical protein
MNFKTFFENSNIANIKLASNPRHRRDTGITNQKTNIVARYHSPHNDYKNSSMVRANYNSGFKKLSNIELQKIISDYGLNLDKRDKTKPFEIALKQKNEETGIGRFLIFDPQKGYSIQMKKAI